MATSYSDDLDRKTICFIFRVFPIFCHSKWIDADLDFWMWVSAAFFEALWFLFFIPHSTLSSFWIIVNCIFGLPVFTKIWFPNGVHLLAFGAMYSFPYHRRAKTKSLRWRTEKFEKVALKTSVRRGISGVWYISSQIVRSNRNDVELFWNKITTINDLARVKIKGIIPGRKVMINPKLYTAKRDDLLLTRSSNQGAWISCVLSWMWRWTNEKLKAEKTEIL